MHVHEERWQVDAGHCVWANGYHVARFSLAEGAGKAYERARLAAAAPKLVEALVGLLDAMPGGVTSEHVLEAVSALELAGYCSVPGRD